MQEEEEVVEVINALTSEETQALLDEWATDVIVEKLLASRDPMRVMLELQAARIRKANARSY